MKVMYAAWALAASLPVFAADLVEHQSNRAAGFQNDNAVLVINFWATYCVPCRKEMPEINRWYQRVKTQQKPKIELAGIALDSAAQVTAFLHNTPVRYPIWRYTGNNSRALMREYGNRAGVLPYTVVRMPRCGTEQAIVGEVDAAKLNRAVQHVWRACRPSVSGSLKTQTAA